MNQALNSNLQKLLILHEGKVNKPYNDIVGKITIGVGRNLTDRGISDGECALMLSNDIDIVFKAFKNNFPTWSTFDEVRQLVVLDMLYNMGINRFLGFKNMIDALNSKDFSLAAKEMLSSKWAGQVSSRASRLVEMMKTGNLPQELA